MSSPRIVVVMSVYNEERYLGETIAATLAQTMADFRLVILDNGSTDTSHAILRGCWQADARLTLLRAEQNLAPGRVANLTQQIALELWPDCQWLVGAGADDVMEPDYFEAILRTADEDPGANLIFSPWRWIDHPEKGVKHFPRFNPETCHAEHQIPAWHAARRDLDERATGYDPRIIGADWDWVVRNRHLIRPQQLIAPYINLRVRDRGRVTQSEQVHWPTLHRHLCGVASKPVPQWARGCDDQC